MEQIDQLVHELASTAATYQPSDNVAGDLSHKVIVPIVGPFAIGKSTILDTVQKQDEDFAVVHNFTTRSPRADDSTAVYTFLPHNPETLEQLVTERNSGNLVQYAVHPTTGYIYGTNANDYTKDYNIAAVLSGSVDSFRRLHFKSCHVITLIASGDDWLRMFAVRSMGMDQDEVLKRLSESRQSVAWSLAQSDVKWVINRFNDPEATAKRVIEIARKGKEGDDGRAVAEGLLATIDELLSST